MNSLLFGDAYFVFFAEEKTFEKKLVIKVLAGRLL